MWLPYICVDVLFLFLSQLPDVFFSLRRCSALLQASGCSGLAIAALLRITAGSGSSGRGLATLGAGLAIKELHGG